MEPTRWEQAQSLFHQAVELPASERQAFLESASGRDAGLIAEVLAMLEADGASSLLDVGVSGIAGQFIASSADAVPARQIGPYRLIEILGEGGMGVVWRAQREDTGAIVAIKLLLGAGFSPARRERFTREIKTLAKLTHPYIARLYDAGALDDGTPWFAMEYVEGERLTEYCQKRELPVEERLRIFLKICEAIQYAHSQVVIHRDVKPSNMLVEKDGTPRILDFGIARELQGTDDHVEHTRQGPRFYSPVYAAPEWIRDGAVGFFTDVYSLGVILYELLAGKLPVDRTNGAQEERGLQDTLEKPSIAARDNTSLGKTTSRQSWPDLDLLCLTAMSWNVNERYKSVEALLRDIDHYLRSEPLEARPVSARYRLEKFLKRNRRPVLAASLTFALVVALIVFFTVRLARARDAALAEAARTQRIQDFMVDMLGDGSESNAGPPTDLRVVTMLDNSLTKASALESDPESQAELYKTLGRMYNLLGQYDKSGELLSLALEKEKLARGPNNARVADLLIMRGTALGDRNQFKDGEKSIRDGLALATQILPPDDPEIKYAKAALGNVLCESGSYKEAIEILEPIAQWTPATNMQAQTLGQSLVSMSVAQYSLGQYDAAETTARRALALDRRLYGDSHPRVAGDLLNIGLNMSARYQYQQSESYYRQAITILTTWYGPDNPETAIGMSQFARTLLLEGKDEEAYPILKKALAVQDRAYNGKDSQLAVTLDTLGRIEVKRSDLASAHADFSRAAEMDQSLFGDQSYQTAVMRADLGDTYVREGQYERGERILRDAVAVLKASFPPDDRHVVRAQTMWGHSLLLLKQYREAQVALDSAYEVLNRQPSLHLDELGGVRHDLAEVYVALHQPDKARTYEISATNTIAPSPTARAK
jgi:serine/threonine-protein kinase